MHCVRSGLVHTEQTFGPTEAVVINDFICYRKECVSRNLLFVFQSTDDVAYEYKHDIEWTVDEGDTTTTTVTRWRRRRPIFRLRWHTTGTVARAIQFYIFIRNACRLVFDIFLFLFSVFLLFFFISDLVIFVDFALLCFCLLWLSVLLYMNSVYVNDDSAM